MTRFLHKLGLLALLALLAAALPQARPALANALSVTNINDSGSGSLRQAIIDANASAGSDTISFNIAASSPDGHWTIQPLSPLPALSGGSITLDGSTQPCSSNCPSGPKIVLDGSQAGISHGLTISSSGNTIKGLVINNFKRVGPPEDAGGAGVYIVGPSATSNRVIGCFIGVTPDGTTAAKNSDWGVLLDDGASDNTIGGTVAGEGNLIAGNGKTGYANIAIQQVKPNSVRIMSGNRVIGNYIGVTPSGAAAIGGAGNPGNGVLLGTNAQSNTVGGSTAAERNVISGHSSSQILVSAGVVVASPLGNSVLGNYIGVAATGASAVPNAVGVLLTGSDSAQIGAAGAGNVIAGNSSAGVLVEIAPPNGHIVVGNQIAGNQIGLNAAGNPLGNGGDGVQIHNGATKVTVGPGNVISANGALTNGEGVRITNSNAGDNVVKGNYIGTNASGTATSGALANRHNSIWIDDGAHNNLIGGAAAADRNVIVAKTDQAGVRITGPATANSVQGNYIGVNAAGTTALTPGATTSIGVYIHAGATNNIVGGAPAGAGNLISANAIGVEIADSGTSGNQALGNQIGVDKNGQPLGNTVYGVHVWNSAPNNQIGGTSAGQGNLIASSGGDGIAVEGASTTPLVVAGNALMNNAGNGIRVSSASGVRITQTTTSGNGGDGIALVGGNGSHSPPTLQVSGTTLSGSAPGCAACVIEIFTGPAPPQNGEGPRYLATTQTDGSGNFSLSVVGCDPYLTATARYPGDNTTEFTNPMVGVCTTPPASLELSAGVPASSSGAPVVANPGAQVVYTHILTNTGSTAGNFTVSRTTTQGWAGAPTPASGTLAPGASQTITITVSVPLAAAPGALDQTTLTATIGSASQSQSDYTRAGQTSGVQIEPDHTSQYTPTTALPIEITYLHTITNTGNGPDLISLSGASSTPGAQIAFPSGATCDLAAGAACERSVRITLPAAGLPPSDTTVVTATAATGASDSARDVTTFVLAPVVQILPSEREQSVQPVSATLTFTHTVANVGFATGTFSVTAEEITQPSWTFAITPQGDFALAPGSSRAVTLTVDVPDGPAAGPHLFRVTAHGPGNRATATDTVDIAGVPGLLFAPDRSGSTDPGMPITYTHMLTNTGNITDNFTLSLASDPGWSATVTPSVALLPPGESAPVTVVVTAPLGVPAGSTGIVTATAISAQDPSVQGSVTDTTTINEQVGALLLPHEQTQHAGASDAGATVITFTHTLSNSGSISSSFALSATIGPLDWAATITPTLVGPLDPGQGVTVVVSVTVPVSTALDITNTVTLQVYQQGHPETVLDTAYDTIIVGFKLFFPLIGEQTPLQPLEQPRQAALPRRSAPLIT